MSSLQARFHTRLDEIDAHAWDALRPDDNPFVSHAFLAGLERHGCIDTEHGWVPYHAALYKDGNLLAAAPLYIKLNSHGEYVFDWSWADAFERYGADYYPKLLCAVPYSPVAGPRLLVGDGGEQLRRVLIELIRGEARRNGWSSAHLNFASDADAHSLADDMDWLPRFDWQFHWQNTQGWANFEDFLGALSAKKRKNIRQERAQVARAGVHCEIRHGGELGDDEWHAVHRFYESTFDEKGNYAALTLPFFRHLGATLPRNVLAVLARRGAELVAAALLLRSSTTLYGRYWGCREQVPGLHFEACYYQGIDYCLRHGLHRFEPGAQGEHKLARGFLPAKTCSFHYIADRRFRVAIHDALAHEAHNRNAYHAELMQHTPYAR